MGFRDKQRVDMPFQMIDTDEWYIQAYRERFGKTEPYQQRSCQPRPVGDGNGVQIVAGHTCLLQRRLDDGYYEPLVSPGGEFGNHASESLVFGLRRHNIGEQYSVRYYGGSRIVARCFDAKYQG